MFQGPPGRVIHSSLKLGTHLCSSRYSFSCSVTSRVFLARVREILVLLEITGLREGDKWNKSRSIFFLFFAGEVNSLKIYNGTLNAVQIQLLNGLPYSYYKHNLLDKYLSWMWNCPYSYRCIIYLLCVRAWGREYYLVGRFLGSFSFLLRYERLCAYSSVAICDPLWEKVQFGANYNFEIRVQIAESGSLVVH